MIMETHKYYVLVALIVFWIFLWILYAHATKREKIITVKTKVPLEGENRYGRNTIITDDNQIFNTTNSIFHNHYDYDSIYDMLVQNKKYKITCYGFRIEKFDTYPNIIKVEEVWN